MNTQETEIRRLAEDAYTRMMFNFTDDSDEESINFIAEALRSFAPQTTALFDRDALNTAMATFKYKYSGGGYFRDSTIPKGDVAGILHGEQVLVKFVEHIATQFTTEAKPCST
jgi:hypothetical protein